MISIITVNYHQKKFIEELIKSVREILKNFETWVLQHGFYVVDKADSDVAGGKGNLERFYHLKIASIS